MSLSRERLVERLDRLRQLSRLRAPDCVLVEEAKLVAEAWDGGPWRHAVRTGLRQIASSWRYRVTDPILRCLCLGGLYHPGQGSGGLGCPFCDKGTPEELLDCSREKETP